jgi:hypothetical protein
VLQRAAFFGQRDHYLPLVAQVSGPAQQAGCLEALQERSQRAGFQGKGVGNCAHRLPIFAPQHVEHEILRVSQAQLVEEGLVGALDGDAGSSR